MEGLYARKRQNSKDILAYKGYTLRERVLEVSANSMDNTSLKIIKG